MHIVVLCTAKSKEEAQDIAKQLVAFKLAACVNIIDQVQSIYSWEGKICEEAEVLMVIKTKKSLFEDLEKAIRTHHSYENPEIIALPIEKGSKPYLSWIDQSIV